MKVFRMNDFDWVCAENEEQAKRFYAKETEFSKEEIDEEFQGEVSLKDTMLIGVDDLPLEELKQPQYIKNVGGEVFVYKNFEWVIEHEKITKPCIISSTEY